MRIAALCLFLASLIGCNSKWAPLDLDGDGYTLLNGDCDEGDSNINPDAAEVWYNGIDENCDGNDGDQDGDGYVPQDYADAHPEWPDFPAHVAVGDCWDDPAEAFDADYTTANGAQERPTPETVNSGATDLWYDGVDQNCDGADDFDQDVDNYPSAAHTRADGNPAGDDCDDLAAEINPGITTDDCYDGIDADCAGNSDYDCDGDGYDITEECDDADPNRYPDPGIPEIWYDGIDDNCDGNDGDQDGDGYVPDSVVVIYASMGLTWEDFAAHLGVGDCWDDPADSPDAYTPSLNGLPNLDAEDVHPGANDVPYDGVDADCQADSDFDADGDGEETSEYTQRDGSLGSDCDDNNTSVNTGATEDCGTSYDDNCDGDDNDANAIGCSNFYQDADSDAYGDSGASRCLCEPEGDYTVADNTDCDDGNAEVYPGATERCNGVDDDCDGTVDNNTTDTETWYRDNDSDGYGDTNNTVQACAQPPGYTNKFGDCDDNNYAVNPEAVEVCDSVDNNCDGNMDDADNTLDTSTAYTWYEDGDNDGQGDALSTAVACLQPSGYVFDDRDCDDGDAAVYTGATEVCNGIDDDCDSFVDDADPNLDTSTASTWYADQDSDGYGDPNNTRLACAQPSGYLSDNTDCDDAESTVNPGVLEFSYDTVDQNCDGVEPELLWTVDRFNGRLYECDLVVGGCTVIASGLGGMLGVAYDGNMTLYVSQFDTGMISSYDLALGTTTTFATGLSGPAGLEWDWWNGRLLLAELNSGEVTAVDSAGTASTLCSGLSTPIDVEAISSTDVAFTERGVDRVASCAAGVVSPLWSMSEPQGLTMDQTSVVLYAASRDLGQIIDDTGAVVFTGLGTANNGKGVCALPSGEVAVVDAAAASIHLFTPGGSVETPATANMTFVLPTTGASHFDCVSNLAW